MNHDAFISYSDRDKAVAEAVCAALEAKHIRCWIAPRDVLPGSEWAEAVVDALDASRVFVLVLSAASNKSPQVIREVGRAASKGIPIIPLRIDDVPPSKAIEFFVGGHHWLDAQTTPLEKHLNRLAATLQRLLGLVGPEYPAREEAIEKAEPAEVRLRCAFHPDREPAGMCVNCGKLVCHDCSDIVAGKYYCHQCAEQVRRVPKAPPPERPAEPARPPEVEKPAEKPPEAEKPAVKKPPKAEKPAAKPSGLWQAGIALLVTGAAFAAIMILVIPPTPYTTVTPWYIWFTGVLMYALPFVIPGVICLRLAIARQFRGEPATGRVPNWWWGLPVVIGFIGGIASWVKQKGVNWHTARNMLTVGILLTLLWAVPFFILVSPSPLPVSPPPEEPPTPLPVSPPPEEPPTPPTPPEEKPLTAADIPELAELVARGQVNKDLPWNPFEGLLVKPDGTPYKVALTLAIGEEVEPTAQALKMMEDFFPRFGLGEREGNWTIFDPEFDLNAQIDWLEDMMTKFKPDWIMLHAVDAELEVPIAEKVIYEGGIPIFTADCGIESDAITSFIAHKFEGPGGTDVLGKWLIAELERRGYGPDNPCVVAELWGMRNMKTAQLRSEGFHKVIDREPWITVIESADTNWSAEETANITADMITAHPEIVALFHHGCGGSGMVPGLEIIGRLLPRGDPDHIIITSTDVEFAMWEQVIDGQADASSTHSMPEPCDICFQVAITSIVLGQPVAGFYQCPFIMVDASNIDTVQIGGVPPYPAWPRDRWDVWLPADPEPDYGFPQPSLELRQLYMGY